MTRCLTNAVRFSPNEFFTVVEHSDSIDIVVNVYVG